MAVSDFRNALRVVVAGLNSWGASELADEVERVGKDAALWMGAVETEEAERRRQPRDTRTSRS
jgi:hypothetical protein